MLKSFIDERKKNTFGQMNLIVDAMVVPYATPVELCNDDHIHRLASIDETGILLDSDVNETNSEMLLRGDLIVHNDVWDHFLNRHHRGITLT